MAPFVMVSTGKDTLGEGLVPTGKVGQIPHDRGEIAKLYRQIDAPDIGLDTRSVPDVWAQLLKFHQTLTGFDPDDLEQSAKSRSAFQAVRARWRGLLALVVLRKELGLTAALKLMPLFPSADTVKDGGRFTQVAYKLLPDGLTGIKLGWEGVNAITLHDVTIGCTSPLTFVCPAASLPLTIANSGYSWFNLGVFTDPVQYLTGPYLHCLSEWLRDTIDSLAPGTSTSDTWQQYTAAVKAVELRRELSAFRKDIQARMNGSGKSVTHEVQTDHDQDFQSSGLIQNALQKLVSTSSVVTIEQAMASSFRLLPAPGLSPATPVLLIGQSLIKLPGFEQGEIEVLKGVTLNQAVAEYKRGEHHRLKTLNFDVCAVYSTEEVFCDRLFVTRVRDVRDAFPGAHSFPSVSGLERRGDSDPIAPMLPIQSVFLDYFTPAYLLENVEFRGSESEITVSLRVTLNHENTGRRKAHISLSKTYRVADNTMVFARLPEVRIWPQYSEEDLPGWKSWYTYYNDLNNPGQKLYIAPLPRYCAKAGLEVKPQARIVDVTDKVKGIEITQCSSFPAVFVSKLNGGEVGLLLAKPDTLKRGEHFEPWEIGIDFGTSGTSVFYARGNGTPRRLELEPHVLALTSANISESYRFFLPTQRENTNGLLSIFKDFRGMRPESNMVMPFTDGHISFVDRSRRMPEDLSAEGVCADMKWGNALERARGVAFLKQLCLLTALQVRVAGGTQAQWAFSYPLSFSSSRLSNFKTHWENSVAFALENSGLTAPDGEAGLRERNESVCAAKYARNSKKANLDGGATVLDIGGGTSDLSIWRREKDKPQQIQNLSVRFAGRDLLQLPLWHKPEILTRLASSAKGLEFAQTLAANKALHDNKTLFFSQVDSFFNLEGDELLLRALSQQAGEREVKDFVGILSLGMQGLFFYTGLLLRVLASEGRLEQRLPDVFVCGNGGKILKWLGFGTFREHEPAEEGLLEALLAGTGFPREAKGNAKIFLSQEPKSEAAYGLLVDPQEKESRSAYGDDQNKIIAGEEYSLTGRGFDALSIVPYREMYAEPFQISANPAMLATFLAATGRQALPPRTLQDVVAEVNQELAAIAVRRKNLPRDEKDALRENEQPIFIVLLNELVKNAATHWAEGKPAWWI